MTYLKRFDSLSDGEKKLFEQITLLEEGEILKIGPLLDVMHTRWKVYSWLQESQLKRLFIIRRKGNFLWIERKQTSFETEKIGGGLPERLENFLREAIKHPEPERYLTEKYRKGELSAQEFAEVLSTYHDTQK